MWRLMNLTTEPPTAEKFARLVRNLNEKQAQHIINAGTLFVCGYDDDDRLIGLIQYVGNGMTWVNLRIDVIQGKQREGIGTALRIRMIEECESMTLGTGAIYGWFERSKAKFWNNPIPGTTVNSLLAVGSRGINGKA